MTRAASDGVDTDEVTRLAREGPSATGKTTGPLKVGERFGARYRITRLLGAGGMGAVYEAWDSELGVSVALKVIRPEATGDPSAVHDLERRFKRELLLARQVTHKNVVRIHDLGEIDGVKYITMSYVDGQDLATILKVESRLPIARALSIARQALSGLVAAHAAGIVHRDLKPANIMVDGEGQALLMDFGIARSVGVPADQITAGRHRTAEGAFGETIVGAVVGTVQYMAPEQARGLAVDHRADIYAFGLILRDMLVGRRIGAPTAFAELQKRLDEAPPPPKSIDPTIPEPLDRVVCRCLAPNPDDRYQTAAELEADLGRLDENGELIPVHRVVALKVMIAAIAAFLVLLVSTWRFARGPAAPVQHDPVSVVIADFRNSTGDPSFDRTLEPMLKIALESAGFISAYDRNGIGRSLGVRPPETLDERAAQELAVKQGLGLVLSGSVDRQGSRYGVSVKATEAVTGKVIATVNDRASSRNEVLGTATRLAAAVRKSLGDDTSDTAQRFAMETLSATSLDVVRDYAAAAQAMSNSKFEDAFQSFSKAVQQDPNFGLAYAGMAIASRNIDRQQDAERYIKEAVSHLDGMTERERYRTRGLFYLITGDSQQCVKEFGDLTARYAADASARNNLALCLTYLRNLPKAVDEMRLVVKILPKRALYRVNLALYADYSGDFQTAEREARAIENPSQFAYLALAFAQLGQGQLSEARETYEGIGKIDALGASYQSSGLGDLAMYEARFTEAARIFSQGATMDLASMDKDRAANKFAALAHVQLLRQQKPAAISAAEKALANSNAVKIRFLAARVFIDAGAIPRARTLLAGLASELQSEPQAYAKIIEAEAALKSADARQAIKLLTDANGLLDTWIGHFDLGLAYLSAGAFTQADSEFDRCLKRRGEALALFLDEEPTFGYFPLVYYYQGRVREELKNAKFAESYRAYLDIRGKSTEDPLLPEVRRRAGQ